MNRIAAFGLNINKEGLQILSIFLHQLLPMNTVYCQLTKKQIPVQESYRGGHIRETLRKLIQKEYPDFTIESFISVEKLNEYRKRYITQLIEQEKGEVNKLEKDVIRSVHGRKILSENIEEEINVPATFGQQVADRIASFGGSWTFILSFFSFLAVWMMINVWLLTSRPFDPYPFILLNLILSCLAAIQAPIIIMSQNRKEEKDRHRSEHNYKINLKAEIEIRLLHEKIDHLIVHQNQRLLEIQQLQSDYLEDILQQVKK
jgi:uncharacterized membrane protein